MFALTSVEELGRPIGPLEKGLILTDEKRRGSKLIVLLRLNSKVRLVPEMVREALILLAKRFPLLRMKIVKKSQNGEAAEEHFTEVEDPRKINFKVAKDFTAEDLEPVFERESDIPLDFNSGCPLWRASLLNEIHNAQKNTYKNAIIFTFNHVITDGRSIVVLLKQFFSYINSLYEGQDVLVESMPLHPSTADLLRHCCSPSVLDKVVFYMTSRISRFKSLLLKSLQPENLYLSTYPPVFTRDSSAPNKTSFVYREVSPNETLALLKRCKIGKCSVHGAITAAAHIAMAKILQKAGKALEDPLYLKSSCNVDLRRECKPEIKSEENVLCVSSFRMEIKVPPVDGDFWAFAKECTRKVQWAFHTGQHHKFLKECHMKLTAEGQQGTVPPSQQDLRVFNVSNMGRHEWDAGAYRFAGIASSIQLQPTGPVFGILCATMNGTMCWTNNYNMRLVTREQAVEFLELTLESLKEACSA